MPTTQDHNTTKGSKATNHNPQNTTTQRTNRNKASQSQPIHALQNQTIRRSLRLRDKTLIKSNSVITIIHNLTKTWRNKLKARYQKTQDRRMQICFYWNYCRHQWNHRQPRWHHPLCWRHLSDLQRLHKFFAEKFHWILWVQIHASHFHI